MIFNFKPSLCYYLEIMFQLDMINVLSYTIRLRIAPGLNQQSQPLSLSQLK